MGKEKVSMFNVCFWATLIILCISFFTPIPWYIILSPMIAWFVWMVIVFALIVIFAFSAFILAIISALLD